MCTIFLASLFWSFLCLHVTPRIVFGFFFFFWSGLCPHVTPSGYPPTAIGYPPTAIGYPPTAIGYPPTAIGYPPTAIGYPPTAIVGRIGHSEFFFFITAPPGPAVLSFPLRCPALGGLNGHGPALQRRSGIRCWITPPVDPQPPPAHRMSADLRATFGPKTTGRMWTGSRGVTRGIHCARPNKVPSLPPVCVLRVGRPRCRYTAWCVFQRLPVA